MVKFSILGMEKWNNKAMIRALSSDAFKLFKPSAWNLIKSDYGFDDDLFGDEDDL